MQLDIYLLDAGNIDGWRSYGSLESRSFKEKFPNGFDKIYQKANSIGCRSGIWLGPDGFGRTKSEAQTRIEMMTTFCRDYRMALFKFDACASDITPEREIYFIRAMAECRKYCPDLIVLNHRINFSDSARAHTTTFLWKSAETYIDVHNQPSQPVPHHRGRILERGLVPELKRLTEDHGVCMSSYLDFWDDELVLQVFNRNPIMSPEIYGNPWLLRDNEFPKLARIFNLHRRYRDILVDGVTLPEKSYGPFAVSRGDDMTRFLTLRNLTWKRITYTIQLGDEIGLKKNGAIELRRLHPAEKIIGNFAFGETVSIVVEPFRSCLLMAKSSKIAEVGVDGCDFEVMQDVPGEPLTIKLLGLPGTRAKISLPQSKKSYAGAKVDGNPADDLIVGKTINLSFPGIPLKHHWHRKLGDLKPCKVPKDAEALYEATCFAADNNALEVRSLQRSGATQIPQVQAARDAFFKRPEFAKMGVWDKNLFDGDPETCFRVKSKEPMTDFDISWLKGGALRIDFGAVIEIDELILRDVSEDFHPQTAEASADLSGWRTISFRRKIEAVVIGFRHGQSVRYVRFDSAPDRFAAIVGYHNGVGLDRFCWRVINLFKPFEKLVVQKAWSTTFTLDEFVKSSYLAISIKGFRGKEGAFAALRIDGKPVGAADRSVRFPCNAWEYPVRRADSNYTYYIPVREEFIGKSIDAIVLGLNEQIEKSKWEVWITTKRIPYKEQELLLW